MTILRWRTARILTVLLPVLAAGLAMAAPASAAAHPCLDAKQSICQKSPGQGNQVYVGSSNYASVKELFVGTSSDGHNIYEWQNAAGNCWRYNLNQQIVKEGFGPCDATYTDERWVYYPNHSLNFRAYDCVGSLCYWMATNYDTAGSNVYLNCKSCGYWNWDMFTAKAKTASLTRWSARYALAA